MVPDANRVQLFEAVSRQLWVSAGYVLSEGGDHVAVRNIDLIDVFGGDNVVTVDAGVLERLN